MIGHPSPEQEGQKGNYHHPISLFAESKQRRIGLHPFVCRRITPIDTGIPRLSGRGLENYPRRGYRARDDVESPIKQNKPRRAMSLNGYYRQLKSEYARSFLCF